METKKLILTNCKYSDFVHHLVVFFMFKMFLKASDPLSDGMNVSVKHGDRHGTFIFVCVDTGVSSVDRKHRCRHESD